MQSVFDRSYDGTAGAADLAVVRKYVLGCLSTQPMPTKCFGRNTVEHVRPPKRCNANAASSEYLPDVGYRTGKLGVP